MYILYLVRVRALIFKRSNEIDFNELVSIALWDIVAEFKIVRDLSWNLENFLPPKLLTLRSNAHLPKNFTFFAS